MTLSLSHPPPQPLLQLHSEWELALLMVLLRSLQPKQSVWVSLSSTLPPLLSRVVVTTLRLLLFNLALEPPPQCLVSAEYVESSSMLPHPILPQLKLLHAALPDHSELEFTLMKLTVFKLLLLLPTLTWMLLRMQLLLLLEKVEVTKDFISTTGRTAARY